MTVYEAIQQMRLLSARKLTFAVSFMTYSRQRHTSHGVVAIEHASVVKNQRTTAADGGKHIMDTGELQDYMLTLHDHDTNCTRQAWQPLILSFNHQPLDSID